MKWSPDTCDCVFECHINEAGNLDWTQTYNTCASHSALEGQNLLNEVIAENRQKNLADSQ